LQKALDQSKDFAVLTEPVPRLGEHKESHLGAAWSGRSLSTCLRSWQARLAV
jgi:hypothetical protein